MSLHPHQQRVIEEKTVLDEKLNKLREFLGGTVILSLPADERGRLLRQADVMGRYSDILGERIAAF